MSAWRIRLVLTAFLLGCMSLTPCLALDKEKKKAVEGQVRKLRDLKIKGKRANWEQTLEARKPMLEALKTDAEALRYFRLRFYWDVARHHGREAKQEGLLKEIQAFMAVSEGLDADGRLRQRFSQVEMLGEAQRDAYEKERTLLLEEVHGREADFTKLLVNCYHGAAYRYWSWGKTEKAAEALKELHERFPDNGEARNRIFDNVRRMLWECTRRKNAKAVTDSLRDLYTVAEDKRSTRDAENLWNAIYNAELQAGNGAGALAAAKRLLKFNPKNIGYLLAQARALARVGRADEAVEQARSLILQNPTDGKAFEAQAFLVSLEVERQDWDKALGRARILLDVSMDERQLESAVKRIATILSARDGHVEAANAFVVFQSKPTPAAKDKGATQTTIAPLVDPAFQTRLVAAAEKCKLGLNPASYRKAAAYYLFAGQPDEAFKRAAAAYRLLEIDTRGLEATARSVAAALRARAGNVLAAVPFLTFQTRGRAGIDGKEGTQDDCPDVLGEVTVPTAPETLAAAEKELLQWLNEKPLDYNLQDRFLAYGSALSLAGRADEALGVALCSYAWARDWNRINRAIVMVAAALRSRDHHVMNANLWLDFQRYGPRGKDKKAGTKDDPKNPLQDVKPAIPEALSQAVDEFAKKRLAAKQYRSAGFLLLAGYRIPEAMRAFKRARAHTTFESRALSEHTYDVLAGLKAMNGHVFGANAYLNYQSYGPAGKDKKEGTADDLKDPLAAF